MAKLRGTEAIRPSAIKEICASDTGQRQVTKNTRVYRYHDGTCHVDLHDTDVAVIHPATGKVTLNTGGWYTNTTKDRINQVLRNTGYHVYQHDHRWYISGPGGTRPFKDGMTIKTREYAATRRAPKHFPRGSPAPKRVHKRRTKKGAYGAAEEKFYSGM